MLQPFIDYEEFKDWLSASLRLSHHDLHLLLGVSLTLLFTRMMRVPLGSWRPWIAVAALEAINEAFDFGRYMTAGWPWRPKPTLLDILITLGPPALILAAARISIARDEAHANYMQT